MHLDHQIRSDQLPTLVIDLKANAGPLRSYAVCYEETICIEHLTYHGDGSHAAGTRQHVFVESFVG